MSVEQAYNFKQIDARVSTAGMLSEAQLLSLRSDGYEAVINLLPGDSEYAVAGENLIVADQQIIYRHIPVDFAAPTADDYRSFSEAMDAVKDKKTLVHCAANYRASAFYALYAHHNLGWSNARATEFIESIWQPAQHPQWNKFIRSLM